MNDLCLQDYINPIKTKVFLVIDHRFCILELKIRVVIKAAIIQFLFE